MATGCVALGKEHLDAGLVAVRTASLHHREEYFAEFVPRDVPAVEADVSDDAPLFANCEHVAGHKNGEVRGEHSSANGAERDEDVLPGGGP